uniref:Uncharacterized protein n=1 Tax=Micrurus surinamensis TaxID=129470 RepID=A0A2D4PBS6_MICSU
MEAAAFLVLLTVPTTGHSHFFPVLPALQELYGAHQPQKLKTPTLSQNKIKRTTLCIRAMELSIGSMNTSVYMVVIIGNTTCHVFRLGLYIIHYVLISPEVKSKRAVSWLNAIWECNRMHFFCLVA